MNFMNLLALVRRSFPFYIYEADLLKPRNLFHLILVVRVL